jgi:hypothetical protein
VPKPTVESHQELGTLKQLDWSEPISQRVTIMRILASFVIALLLTVASAQTGAGDHLAAARDLVSRVDLDHTHYEHGQGTVTWSGPPSSYTDCSGFVDHLLMHAYGYSADDFKRWFGSRRPSAKRYYEAVVEQTGFTRLACVTDLRPGDFIVITYLKRTDNTGHIMLVDRVPERETTRRETTRFGDPHGDAWLVRVIDSSESGHGPMDSRHKRGLNGRDHDGLGQGVLKLYADPQGHITGFSWSALSSSRFIGPDEEPVAFGRLVPGYKP